MAVSAITRLGASVACNGTTKRSITLDNQRRYEIIHTSQTVAGAADTANILLGSTNAFTADLSEEDDKVILTTAFSVMMGPGIDTLYFCCDNAANAPVFTVIPSGYLGGDF